jgi:hypothetical protein
LKTWWFTLLGQTHGDEEAFLLSWIISIKDGFEIRFWEDKWLGDATLGNVTLREQYPALYAIVCHKGDTIIHVLESNPPNMMFRRNLFGPRIFFGRPCFHAWLMYNWQMGKINSGGTFMGMKNSHLLLFTMFRSYQTYQSMIIRKSGR